ncbi:hypothetical protein PILCRDRAFT_12887 [Piloderma croceum F 1598]|uniref:BTB domain-containing protein n=1 Tax=Piloderma croceum (strain F 1598) TaxID=765440 RepID=A0A0C3F9A2_PILCF|nr:hypothetical protein PILCRDRAFT_12887 [Piloderma croceum F 1598]
MSELGTDPNLIQDIESRIPRVESGCSAYSATLLFVSDFESTGCFCELREKKRDKGIDSILSENADIKFKSGDGAIFKIFSQDLQCKFGGLFPPDEGATKDLDETADVLELLFQFVVPMQPPHLENVPFKIAASLAEAAEKYDVYSAIPLCVIYMKAAILVHPFENTLKTLSICRQERGRLEADYIRLKTIAQHSLSALSATLGTSFLYR